MQKDYRSNDLKLTTKLSIAGLIICSAGTTALAEESRPQITMGNGEQNWILTENVNRTGNTLVFPEVNIHSSGWLVMHPFEDGKPNGDKYVAASYLSEGTNSNVAIEVYKGIATGERFIVMLHNDSNENEIFDFVFVDDVNVMDKAVFEGSKMIGHVFVAP